MLLSLSYFYLVLICSSHWYYWKRIPRKNGSIIDRVALKVITFVLRKIAASGLDSYCHHHWDVWGCRKHAFLPGFCFYRWFLERLHHCHPNSGHFLTRFSSYFFGLSKSSSPVCLPSWKSGLHFWHSRSWCCACHRLAWVSYSWSSLRI